MERTWQDMQRDGGIARIGVAPATAPFRWADWKRLSGATAKEARHLYDIAVNRAGAKPGNWYLTFDTVPSSKWLSVEAHDGEVWAIESAKTAAA